MSDLVSRLEGEWLSAILGARSAPASFEVRLLGEGVEPIAAVLARAEGGAGRAVVVPSRALDPAEIEASEPGTVFFALGPRGASSSDDAARLASHAWVETIRLVPSQILALTGRSVGEGAALGREHTRELLVVERRAEPFRARELPAPLESDRFSLEEYRALLLRARAAGYRFLGFDEALALDPADDSRVFLLRHDVDLSPRWALAMARLEASLGARSTYFFMVSGAFYDVLEPEHRSAVREIAALGHDVGLHFDEHDDLGEGLQILSVLAHRPTKLVAQHNPTLLPRRDPAEAGIVDAYDPRLTARFVYVSDSGMRFRGESLADVLERGASRVYALCHPEAWLTDGGDLIAMIRLVEQEELARRRRRFDAFVEGNLRYLRARREREGR